MINIDKLYIYICTNVCGTHGSGSIVAQFVASQALGVCRWGAASWINEQQGMRGAIAKYREIR